MAGEMLALAGANDAHDDIKDTIFWQMNKNENRFQQEQGFRNQQKLNSQMARLARMQRITAAYDEVHGLEMAGLSPVLAGGGSFSPAGSSAPGAAVPSSMPNLSHSTLGRLSMDERELSFKQQQWVEAQRDLAASQAEKNRADAKAAESAAGVSESQSKMNDYVMNLWQSRDESIAASAKAFAENVKNSPDATDTDKAIAAAFADCSSPDAGTLEGIEKFLDHVRKNNEVPAQIVSDRLKMAVAQGQLKDPDTLEALRRMPEANYNQLTAAAGELVSQMYLNDSKKELTDQDVKKTRQLIVNYAKEAEKIDAEIAKIQAERKAVVHGDIIQSMEEDPAATILRETYTIGKQVGQAYIGGKTAGNVLKNGGRVLTNKPQEVPFDLKETWRYNKNGQPTSHTRTQMQRLGNPND